jgi:predicted dehydrogenase
MRGVRLAAVADPNPASCQFLSQVQHEGIPVYRSLEALQLRHSCDLVVLSTPLQLHCEQTKKALEGQSHVLCEKPLCNKSAEAAEMIRARRSAKKQVSIGYQWSFSSAIQALKHDISSGLFGEPRRFKTLVLWPRDEAYYTRNDWAGRRYNSTSQLVFDNPLNNACAHHLHNMMYVLGDRPDRSAHASTIQAELYLANNIETFDTAAIRIVTTSGVELLCIVSHATREECGPCFKFEFEDATVEFAGKQPTADTRDGPGLLARFKDGHVKQYGSPERDPDSKLWAAVDSARTNSPTVCGIEAALPHTLVIEALQKMEQSAPFPDSLKRSEVVASGRDRKWIAGLDDVLGECYRTSNLPSELKVPWSVPGQEVQLVEPNMFANSTPRLSDGARLGQGSGQRYASLPQKGFGMA